MPNKIDAPREAAPMEIPARGARTFGAIAAHHIAAIERIGGNRRHARYRTNLIRTHLIAHFGNISLFDLNRTTFHRVKFRLSRKSRRVASLVTTEVKRIYQLARTKLWIENTEIPHLNLSRRPGDRPIKRVRQEKTAQTGLSEEDLVAIWAVATDEDRLLLLLAFGFALRQQEIRGARNGCVVLDHVRRGGYFSVSAVINSEEKWTSVTKTGNAPRTIEFGPTLYNALLLVVAAQPDGKLYFMGNSAKFVGRDVLNKRFKALCLKAGVTRIEADPKRPGAVRTVAKCSLQMARRMGASLWINDKVSEVTVRRWMGHAKEDTSLNWYYYDPRKIGKAKPAPAVRPQTGVSFFSVAASRPDRPARPVLVASAPRPSSKVVRRAALPLSTVSSNGV